MTQNTVIIGGGPAGHELALRLAHGGGIVTLIESSFMGGTCLNTGCVPTKAYLAKAKLASTFKKHRVDLSSITSFSLDTLQSTTFRTISRLRTAMEKSLLATNVTVIKDLVTQVGANALTLASGITVPYLTGILATGTTPWVPPVWAPIINNPRVFTNETIFSLTAPPKDVLIVGGGAIGVELAFIFANLGTSVTLVEAAPQILGTLEGDISKDIKRQLKLARVKVLEGATVDSVTNDLLVTLSVGQNFTPDAVLIATGRAAKIPTFVTPLATTTKGYVKTNASYLTSNARWYAIGDVNGQSLLAHAASDQAIQLADFLLTKKPVKEKTIPSVVYSLPPAASVGLRSEDAPAGAIVTTTPYSILGRAQIEDATEGWVRLIRKDNRLLGFHGVGEHVEDMLPFMQLAIQEKTPIDVLVDHVAPHPSYCEVMRLALEQSLDQGK